MSIRIDFLSYEGERNNERHPHAQFVLPIAGELEISIGGAEGRLTPSCAAFVAPGVPHSQLATVSNAFLIVNCDLAECGVPAAEQLAEQIFLPVSEATRHLIGFAELSRDRFSQPGTTQCWMPLLLNSFLERPVCRPSRLAVLERLIDAHPGAPWTVGEMARRIGISPSRLHALFFCLFGVLSISVFFSSLQISIQLSGAAMAMVLLYTAPAWVAVFSRILFHESFSSRKGIALGLALFGTALVCFSGGSLNAEPSVLGIVCGLISGLCYASHFPFYVWWQSRYSTATLYAYMLLGGALALFPFVDFAPTRSWTAWANLLALGVVTNYGAYLAYGRSLQSINQVKAAIIGNIEPVLATFWVWLFWNENFSAYGWAGSALVISAVFLLTADRS